MSTRYMYVNAAINKGYAFEYENKTYDSLISIQREHIYVGNSITKETAYIPMGLIVNATISNSDSIKLFTK